MHPVDAFVDTCIVGVYVGRANTIIQGYNLAHTDLAMSSPQRCLHCAQQTLSVAALACLVWSGVYPVVDEMCMCMCV